MEGTGNRSISSEPASVVAEELALLARTREALAEARGLRRGAKPDGEELRALRDEWRAAGEEDRPALLAQMHEVRARMERAREGRLPDPAAPYFAHLRVRVAGRSRDVLLGPAPMLDAKRGVTVVEWRRAPIAEVFFACEEGEEYEIEVDGRTIEGVVEERRLLSFEGGALASITVPGGVLLREGDTWRFESRALAPTLVDPTSPRRTPETRNPFITLDAEQRALVDREPRAPLLVLGSAGSGKTTVALHRVAALVRRSPQVFPAKRTLVLVPEPGLRRLSERILEGLAVEGVVVSTFEDWIRAEARRVFSWLPRNEPPDPPFAASRLKRHPALFAAMDRLLDEDTSAVARKLDRLLGFRGALRRALEARAEPILRDRLRALEAGLAQETPGEKGRLLREALKEEQDKLPRVRAGHRRLVGDRALLARVVEAAEGDLPAGIAEQVAAHTKQQLAMTSEEAHAHVDAGRLATLDGKTLDAGTPEEAAGTVDVEDYAILFEWLFRRTGASATKAGALSRYAHIVLDEAQELAPIELRVIGRALDPEGSVTVAGDAAQRIDRSGHFRSWEAVMEALSVKSEPAFLETSYRSPRPIVEFAHAILGADAPAEVPRAPREGAPVLCTVVPGEGHAAAVLCEGLRRLRADDPYASVAIITRDEHSARAVHEAVSRGMPCRLVQDGDFSFGPGIEVTEVSEVKGLEFDYVIIPDANGVVWPDGPEHRRALHVAVTRAMRRVWIVSPGEPSPILPSEEELRRLREVRRR
ncbi:UvrD-helicase domain-containing protein [Polyangium spumosum]|uniref:DNA 3'-5' helicase II n=1 Tax=Polyangium spumosum TaxID=889282 RepID=A0A6N7PYK5_9BACT|nr:UvrD-helicase domain-containing protein [Polyangium spumosum]MRG95355.1 AAA family ATPase [Polyangium spumosum]